VGEERHRKLGEPPETVTVYVGRVTFNETGRFPHGHLGNGQESRLSVQLNGIEMKA
jgi:hypothetical protein